MHREEERVSKEEQDLSLFLSTQEYKVAHPKFENQPTGMSKVWFLYE